MGRLFVCLVVCIHEGFAPEKVARLGYGGFLMLEYQKSSAAVPKPRNWFWFVLFPAAVFALAGVSCLHARLFVVVAELVHQQL